MRKPVHGCDWRVLGDVPCYIIISRWLAQLWDNSLIRYSLIRETEENRYTLNVDALIGKIGKQW